MAVVGAEEPGHYRSVSVDGSLQRSKLVWLSWGVQDNMNMPTWSGSWQASPHPLSELSGGLLCPTDRWVRRQ